MKPCAINHKVQLSSNHTNNIHSVQVAALAQLALLLVLEARCADFVIVHFNNLLCVVK